MGRATGSCRRQLRDRGRNGNSPAGAIRRASEVSEVRVTTRTSSTVDVLDREDPEWSADAAAPLGVFDVAGLIGSVTS